MRTHSCRNSRTLTEFSVLFRYVLVLAALYASAGLTGCGEKGQDGGAVAPPAIPVQVLVVESRKLTNSTEYLAILKSRHSATINPQVEGQITKIFVKSGDRVTAGKPLLQIDPLKQEATVRSQEAARLAQEANVRLAKVNLDRAVKLQAAGVISRADFDNAQTNYDTAVAQLKSLEHQVQQQQVELRYYQVSAPMEGIVGDIPVRVGDRVGVTTLLTTVDEPGALEAYIYVPASRSKDLRLGLPVKLLDESGAVLAQSEITFVSPQVDTDTQTVLAKAAVGNSNTRLRISQQVRAQVAWGTRNGPVVPVLAVQRISGEYFLFVAVKDGSRTVARQRAVKLGEIVGNDYAVLEGVQPGDHVIVSGTQFLQDGAPVTEQLKEAGNTGESEKSSGAKSN